MSVMMKTLVVLWHHRLVLMLILVVLCMLAISAGRRIHRNATLEHVSGLQAHLNEALSDYHGADPAPALLNALAPEDAGILQDFIQARGQVSVSKPVCRRAPARSVVGPQPEVLTCSIQTLRTKPSDIVCESAIETGVVLRPQSGVSGLDFACLVALWSTEHGEWALNTVAIGESKDGPLFHEPSDLDEDTYPKMSKR
jgi:hypothetical protein